MLCPQCQRPLDPSVEGRYVCCAGAGRRWQCTACNQTVAGFAFAYGRCPQCGGALKALDADAPELPAATLDAVRLAFEIELGGRAFYQRAAAETDDAALRDLFGRFAVMEGAHMETLAQRYHIDVTEPSAPLRLEVAAIFAGETHRPEDPANLFRIAIALEDRAAAFFTERAASAPADSAEKVLFEELAEEEQDHAQALRTAWQQWRTGKPGLLSDDLLRHRALPTAAGQTTNAAQTLLAGLDDARNALECGETALTRGALRERVGRAAAVFAARGLKPGDRVAVRLSDGFDWVVAFLGAQWAGMIAVAVNPRIPEAEWHYILDEAGFHAILTEDEEALDTPLPWRARVWPVQGWRRLVDAAEPAPPQPMRPDAPAFWCHSSGTSGKPKAVVHAHGYAQAIAQVSAEGIGVRGDDRLFASSKLFFAYPQTNALLAGVRLGATVILDPKWPTAAGLAATIEVQRPTVVFSVPSMYRNLLHEGLARVFPRAGVRLTVSAGEALPASLRTQWLEQTGLEIIDGYGASETLVLVMLDRGDGRGFQPSPGVQVRSLDQAPRGVPTRLLIRAPTQAVGYLDRPQAQAECFRDGAFCPADLWERTEGGGWRFAGREDSLVKIRGRWVNLIALAEHLGAQAPGLLEGAAVCVPDADGVDAVAFFYVADDDAPVRALLHQRAEALPPYQRPRWLHPVQTLPRGPTGKLLRRQLQQLHKSLV
ncbi:MAG: AMP-binding protein [Burkholderiaceae bacterium]